MKCTEGESLTSRFKITSPEIAKLSFKEIKKQIQREFSIQCQITEKLTVELKGQWLPVSNSTTTSNTNSSKVLCFVGSPMVKSAKENEILGLSISDFALHDPAKDRLFALEALQASNTSKASSRTGSSISMDELSESEDFSQDSYAEGCPYPPRSARQHGQPSLNLHSLSSISAPVLYPSESNPKSAPKVSRFPTASTLSKTVPSASSRVPPTTCSFASKFSQTSPTHLLPPVSPSKSLLFVIFSI